MGAFDGAETCDVIGLFIWHQLSTQVKGITLGLYRDDGLCVCDLTARLAEKARQKIVQIFKDNDLKITSTANLSQVQFLDITLDLKKEVFKPYIKPGDKPIYVHSKSNHPPSIIKNIPLAINNRISFKVLPHCIRPSWTRITTTNWNLTHQYPKERKETEIRMLSISTHPIVSMSKRKLVRSF